MRRFRATERNEGPQRTCVFWSALRPPSLHPPASTFNIRPVLVDGVGRVGSKHFHPCSLSWKGEAPMRAPPERGECRGRAGASRYALPEPFVDLILDGWARSVALVEKHPPTWRTHSLRSDPVPWSFLAWQAGRAGVGSGVGDLGVTLGCMAKMRGAWGSLRIGDCGCVIDERDSWMGFGCYM